MACRTKLVFCLVAACCFCCREGLAQNAYRDMVEDRKMTALEGIASDLGSLRQQMEVDRLSFAPGMMPTGLDEYERERQAAAGEQARFQQQFALMSAYQSQQAAVNLYGQLVTARQMVQRSVSINNSMKRSVEKAEREKRTAEVNERRLRQQLLEANKTIAALEAEKAEFKNLAFIGDSFKFVASGEIDKANISLANGWFIWLQERHYIHPEVAPVFKFAKVSGERDAKGNMIYSTVDMIKENE